MYVRDIMITNVVTVPSNTPVNDARKIMQVHKIRRLPVVDRGKLVGIVTHHNLENVTPSVATSLSVWEINYLLAKMTVSKIMGKNVVTVTPDMTVEEAVATAQSHKVGALPVLEGGKVVGIVTTNDFFYNIINYLFGFGKSGIRLLVKSGGPGKDIEKIVGCVNKLGINVATLFSIALPDSETIDLIIHLDTEESTKVVVELEKLGYKVVLR